MSRRSHWILVAGACALAWTIGCAMAHHSSAPVFTDSAATSRGAIVPMRRIGAAARGRALLLHGVTASKETLMGYADALAASGWECTLIDFPGHGASREAFALRRAPLLDSIRAATHGDPSRFDVVLGHSMGAGAAAIAIDRGVLVPRFFVSVGSRARAPTGVRTLVMSGAWDELIDADSLESSRDVYVSALSDHVLEAYDPFLIDRVVQELAPGGSSPARWWRVGGIATMGCAFLIALVTLLRRGWRSVVLAATAFFATFAAAFHPFWVNAIPTPARLLMSAGIAVPTFGAVYGLGILLARVTKADRLIAMRAQLCLLVLATVGAGISLASGARFIGVCIAWGTVLFAGTILVCTIVEHRTQSVVGAHVLFAAFVGYFVGQWVPVMF